MGTFVSYMAQSALVMTMLYLAYKWLLSSTTFHSFNRAALLGIYVVAWILPALLPLFTLFTAAPAPVSGIDISLETMPIAVAEAEPTTPTFDWRRIALGIYLVGTAATACYSLAGAVKVWRIIRSGERTREDGYIKVVSDAAPVPFSWGRYIVLRPEDCDSYEEMVLAHERAHLSRIHWLDLLLAQVTMILQWFSPAAWLMTRELKSVHEFQADREAAGDDPSAYQMMLLKKTVGSSFPTFTDSLNHSQIKLRITMMLNKKSRPSRMAAALALPVMAALSAVTLSIPAVADVATAIGNATLADPGLTGRISSLKVNESSSAVQIGPSSTSPLAYSDAAVSEEATTEETSAVTEIEAVEETVTEEPAKQNTSPAIFINGKEFKGELYTINPKDIVKMDVVKNDPGYPGGKIMITTMEASDGENRVGFTAEKIAEFKGGFVELRNMIAANIKYPEEAAKAGVGGRVIVSFTIGTDGSVSDVKVMKGVNEALDQEAIRVAKLTSGQWIPASTDGKPIATRFTLPVSFSPTVPE